MRAVDVCFVKVALDRGSVENRMEDLIGVMGRLVSWIMMGPLAFYVVGCGQKIVEITDMEASKERGLFWGSEPMGRDSVLNGEGLTLIRRSLNHCHRSWGFGQGWQGVF